jgi:hypothetical protein
VLKDLWESEKQVLKYDLSKSKAKDAKSLCKEFDNFNDNLAHHLLAAYLEKCKYKHSFAHF